VNTDIVQAAQALERGDTSALAAHLQALFPHDPRAAGTREFIVAILSSPAGVEPIGQELPFLNSAVELIRSRDVLPPDMWLQFLLGPTTDSLSIRSSSRRSSARSPS
jgi:hypothetical protein